MHKFRRGLRASAFSPGATVVVAMSNGVCSQVLADLFERSRRPIDRLHVVSGHVRYDDASPRSTPYTDWRHDEVVGGVINQELAADERYERERGRTMQGLRTLAERHGAEVVLLGDCSDRLAVEMLSCTSGGRGLAAVHRLSPTTTARGVRFVRPMHLIARELIDAWASCRQLAPVVPAAGVAAPQDGVRGLTESFLVHLTRSFPGCIPNIVRTAAKLTLARSDGASVMFCASCGEPIDDGDEASREDTCTLCCLLDRDAVPAA